MKHFGSDSCRHVVSKFYRSIWKNTTITSITITCLGPTNAGARIGGPAHHSKTFSLLSFLATSIARHSRG